MIVVPVTLLLFVALWVVLYFERKRNRNARRVAIETKENIRQDVAEALARTTERVNEQFERGENTEHVRDLVTIVGAAQAWLNLVTPRNEIAAAEGVLVTHQTSTEADA